MKSRSREVSKMPDVQRQFPNVSLTRRDVPPERYSLSRR